LQALGFATSTRHLVRQPRLEQADQRPLDRLDQPGDGERLAQVRGATAEDYEQVMAAAVAAAAAWRQVPAPKRGEAVRLHGRGAAQAQDALGSLVSLENGKIKAEGDGEVQEMIDIADFAVGQSRMLYGNTMHSERPQHRMYEQWHPLGVVGVISAFNFPGGRVVVECLPGGHLRQCHGVEALAEDAAVRARRAAHLQSVLERPGAAADFPIFIDAGTELATRFVDDRRVALVSFTGSTARGPQIGVRVANAGQKPAGAGRQQRHHRRRHRESRPRGARASSSAPSEPPASAAPRRGACWCIARARPNSSAAWSPPTAGAIGDPLEPARSWDR
jgi:acyl-CoA reductase-like NAD-dependent aldehyde dehydrogenase